MKAENYWSMQRSRNCYLQVRHREQHFGGLLSLVMVVGGGECSLVSLPALYVFPNRDVNFCSLKDAGYFQNTYSEDQ